MTSPSGYSSRLLGAFLWTSLFATAALVIALEWYQPGSAIASMLGLMLCWLALAGFPKKNRLLAILGVTAFAIGFCGSRINQSPDSLGAGVLFLLISVGTALTTVRADSRSADPLSSTILLCDERVEPVTDLDFSLMNDFSFGSIEPELSGVEASKLQERIVRCGSFTPEQQNQIQRACKKNRSPSRVLRQLVDQGLLTRFQAAHLLWGREDNLKIDNYLLIDVIGRGGMSTVYRGIDVIRNESVAIKVIRAGRSATSRFYREMAAVLNLAHPNIAVAYHVGQCRARCYIVMELLSTDLGRLVAGSGPISEETALNYLLQTSHGLSQAHDRGLLHRDVKPGNLLIAADGSIKLTDLGLSCSAKRDPQETSEFETRADGLGGTLEFMSPEQARSLRSVDARTDIFSLGSTLFYLVTGRVRLPGNNSVDKICNLTVHGRRHDAREFGVSEPVARLIDRLADYDVEHRIQNIKLAIAEIEQTLAELGKSHKESTIRLLIVEDNEDDMFIALRLLREMNRSLETFEAACWSEAREAIEAANHGVPFDICLLDLNLPDSAGMETIHRFRQIAPHIPLVVMTGINDAEFGQQCIDVGADEYLPKDQVDHKILERSVFITLSRIRVARGAASQKPHPAPLH